MAPGVTAKVHAPRSYAHLIFRSASGSLTWASYWMIVIGTCLVVSGVVQVLGRVPDRWVPPGLPPAAQRVIGAVGLLVGMAFIVGPFLTRPGHLY